VLEDKDQKQIIDQAKVFAEKEIRPYAGEWDDKEALPKSLVKRLAEKKFLTASIPTKYGGLGLDPLHYGRFVEQIGKACSSTRTLITVHGSLVGETILRWGTQEQKDRWLGEMSSGNKIGAFALSEPDVGSDAQNIQTAYNKKGRCFILDGRKKWISFGQIADFFLTIATGEQGTTAFLVERDFDGVRIKPIKGLLAARASHVAEVSLTSVAVPEENMVGRLGTGFSYIAGTALDHGRYCVAWGGLAIAQEALEAMVRYARERSQFDRKIYSFQLIRGMIGDAVAKTHAARALCEKAGEMRKSDNPEAITQTAIAKYFASTVAMDVAADAVQIHGAAGCTNLFPVERLYREAKILEIIEGTSQIQQELIANFGLRHYAKHDIRK
jgi:alkylation response protein AidB-like acyl-CoA dehydrogenase